MVRQTRAFSGETPAAGCWRMLAQHTMKAARAKERNLLEKQNLKWPLMIEQSMKEKQLMRERGTESVCAAAVFFFFFVYASWYFFSFLFLYVMYDLGKTV